MRRVAVGLASLMAICALNVGAQASPRVQGGESKGRTIEIRYEGGAIPYAGCIDCPDVTPRRGERFVMVEVIDDVSPLASLDVAWTTYNPDDPGYFVVCGKTEEPQRIPPSADLTLYPWMIPVHQLAGLEEPCSQGSTPGFSTSGTIKITFMRHP